MDTEDLAPSKLGTKEYWDNIYGEELSNFDEIGDEGEVWFGQESVDKMKDWALKHAPPATDPFIVEIGVGNGNLLFALLEEGYNAKRMAGVDYSPDAIRLARSIAQTKEAEDITFESSDFLNDELLKLDDMDGQGWDLVLDKGTYDAMALAEKDATGRKPCDVYPSRVAVVLKPGGYFLITSCNFTYEELVRIFATQETGLTFHSQVKHQSISFGGVTGSTYCTVAFRKVK